MVGVAIYQAYRKVLQTNRNSIVCLTRGGAAITHLALGQRCKAAIGREEMFLSLDLNPETLSRFGVTD